nr:hypothetical protein CFP56_22252 [Quercus suber]
MAYCGYPEYQYPSSWHIDEKQERFSRPDLGPSMLPLDRFSFSEPADDLLDRYLQETNRTLFKSNFQQPMDPYPDTLLHSTRYVDADGSFYSNRYPSPTSSGRSSLVSSDTSDSELQAWSQPVSAGYSVDFMGGHACYNGDCVALHEVQTYADAQPDKVSFHEDESLPYGATIQEGYHPISVGPCHENEMTKYDISDHVIADVPSDADALPITRRRRVSHNRPSLSAPCPSARVSKRIPSSKRSSIPSPKSSRDTRCHSRAFPCPFAQYGCQSTFGSKNEWKRHTSTQHMRFGFWRCDQCLETERKPNDFNRKDLFVQHVRRMHLEPAPAADTIKTKSRRFSPASSHRDKTDDELLNRIASSCYRRLRSPPPQSGCPFCSIVFSSWDERMEHVGRHLEAARKQDDAGHGVEKEDAASGDLANGKCDEDTEKWLLEEHLLEKVGKRLVLTGGRHKE